MNFKDLLPKNLPFLKSGENQEYYFALNIGTDTLSASVWGVQGKNLQILKITELPVSGDDDLVDAANNALDEVLGNFPFDPEKILFGVPDSWMIDDNLKETHLEFLKHLVKELDVTPMAYVSTSHAISHMIQKQTGVPTTAILVGVADPLVVTLVKGGKVLGTKIVKRSEDLPQDIERALKHFPDVEVLPSKIALYGTGNLEKYHDELLGFNWMNSLPFLHLPKVEVLEAKAAIKAISLAGASEINPDVNYPHQGINAAPTQMSPRGPQMHRNLANVAPVEAVPAHAQVTQRGVSPYPQHHQGGALSSRFNSMDSIKAKILAPLAFLRTPGAGIKLPGASGRKIDARIIAPIAILVVLLLGYLFLAKASVTIYIDPKILEKDAQVVADPNATSVDSTNKVIPGKIIETDVEGSLKGTATGTKQIGNPSKGTVVIYNKTSSVKSFPSGTVLQGPNNLNFTLDSNVDNIATPSADDGTWGSANASVTAAQIGPDSNLASGTQLSVKGYATSDFSAKVDNTFSGGTSQNVQVVTSDDQKKTLAALASNLRSQAQGKLQSQLSGDEKILPEALTEKITNTSYSKRVGDQATDFNLDMTIHYTGTAYSNNDLMGIVSQLVQTNVPDGYELNLAGTKTDADVSNLQKDGKLVFLAKFEASLIPKLDQDQIKNRIKGKSPAAAQQIIQSYDNVIGSDISIHPNLPGPLKLVPFLSRNIDINVTTK